jgi:hypothetical protein
MRELPESDLNLLYAAALEFGANWRRPLVELAAERLPERPREYRDSIATLVGNCRKLIEVRIEEMHRINYGEWAEDAVGEAAAWIADRYSWITELNRRHGWRPRSGVNETTGVGSPSRATNSSKERTYTRACSSIAYRPYPPPHR